jgi:hypothetical protein
MSTKQRLYWRNLINYATTHCVIPVGGGKYRCASWDEAKAMADAAVAVQS